MTKSLTAALALSLLLGTFAYAEGETPDPTAEEATTPVQQTDDIRKGVNPSDAPDIKVGVNVYVVSLENLKEIGMAIQEVREAASDLCEEVSRREVTLTSTPNVVGYTVLSMPSGFTQGAYLPPRKKWVDAYMQDMSRIVKLMKDECDDVLAGKAPLVVPAPQQEEVKAMFAQWVGLVNDTFNKVAELEKTTSQPMLNNASIANAALAINKDMKNLEALRKKVYKIYQKAGQRAEETASLTGDQVK
ncbi:MAG: hypothetical protein K2Y22_09880 [Candidatus Obscuribacterales bacterium]|nr:hypothetical protein [Candidatus Obscuribacterales bacterium]